MGYPGLRALGLCFCLAALLSTNTDVSAASEDGPEPARESITRKLEQGVMEGVNTERRKRGLPPLRLNETLSEVARSYSRRMAKQQFFAHVGPRGDTVADRIGKMEYSMLGENLYQCTNYSDPDRRALTAWLGSDGHRKNMLHPEFTHSGVGIWKEGSRVYITQVFIRRDEE